MAFTIRNSSQKTFGDLKAILRSNIINDNETLILKEMLHILHSLVLKDSVSCYFMRHMIYQLDKVGPLTNLAHLAQTCP